MSRHSVRVPFVPVLLAAALAVAAPAARAATPVWTLSTGSVEFQRLTPLGTLLVSSSEGLGCVDPATGQWQWKRDELKKFKECNYDEIANTPYGLLDIGEGMGGRNRRVEVIDLASGQKKWDSANLPFQSSQGLFQVAEKRMLVLFGPEKPGSMKSRTVAVDTETGEIKWQADRLFEKPIRMFEVKGSGKIIKRMSVEGNQPPVVVGDKTMVLWISEDGPVGVDPESGNKLWVCDALKGKEVPALNDGYCGMLLADGVVYVPVGKALQALDPATGKLLWAKEHGFKGRPVQMWMTEKGLLVRGAPTLTEEGKLNGKAYIDLIDPKSGASAWAKPFKDLDDATSFEVKDGAVFIAADNELHEIDLASGASKMLAKYKMKEKEVPSTLELRGDQFLLLANQSLLMLDRGGNTVYSSYFEAPSFSGWMKLGVGLLTAAVNAAAAGSAYDRAQRYGRDQTYYLASNPTLGKRFRASTDAQDYMYILTNTTGDGKKGPGLVKVNKTDGKAVGELRLGDKTPEYVTDSIEKRVFFLKNENTIEGYAF